MAQPQAIAPFLLTRVEYSASQAGEVQVFCWSAKRHSTDAADTKNQELNEFAGLRARKLIQLRKPH